MAIGTRVMSLGTKVLSPTFLFLFRPHDLNFRACQLAAHSPYRLIQYE